MPRFSPRPPACLSSSAADSSLFVKWVLTAALLARVLSAATGSAFAQGGGPVPVKVGEVVEREVSTGQAFVGTVTPVRRSVIGSAVAGRIVSLKHNEGDYVQEGEVLAQVLTGTIEIELAHAKAELRIREEELAESVQSFPAEKEQADARLAAARASRDNAKAMFERQQALFAKGSTSAEAIDSARAKAQETDAMFVEAQAARRLIFDGAREQKIRQLEGKIESQKEQVNLIEDRLKKYTIRAYFTGYVTAEYTEVGHWIRDGESVVEMAEIDEVDIRVNVNEDAIADLEVGHDVRVEVNATKRKSFVGKIQAIVPQADVRSRSFPVLVRVQNPRRESALGSKDAPNAVTHDLKSGMLARAILPVGRPKQSLMVSKDSVVLGGRAPILFVISPGTEGPDLGTVRPVPVELGIADEGEIQVTPVSPEAPLRPGDLVVVEGNERLRPGQAVKFSKRAAVTTSAAR